MDEDPDEVYVPQLGDLVRCRDGGKEWRSGIVTDAGAVVKVVPDGWEDATVWEEVVPAPDGPGGRIFYGMPARVRDDIFRNEGAAAVHFTEVSPAVCEWLLADPSGLFGAPEHELEARGLLQSGTDPGLWEGRWHGLDGDAPVGAAHPRFRWDAPRRPAPPRLLAYARALRRVNAAALAAAAETLAKEAGPCPLHDILRGLRGRDFRRREPDGGGDMADPEAAARGAAAERVFADVSVAVRHGAGASGALCRRAFPSAMLSVTLSLRGDRQLRALVLPHVEWVRGEVPCTLRQAQGTATVSNMTAYPHRYDYTPGGWDARVVTASFGVLLNHSEASWEFVREGEDPLARLVAAGALRLPDLDDLRGALPPPSRMCTGWSA